MSLTSNCRARPASLAARASPPARPGGLDRVEHQVQDRGAEAGLVRHGFDRGSARADCQPDLAMLAGRLEQRGDVAEQPDEVARRGGRSSTRPSVSRPRTCSSMSESCRRATPMLGSPGRRSHRLR